jgi:hypothetical protein
MSELSALERGYRRLLAWYPQSFRHEQEDEMLTVLMAGARPGQRRPGLLETADLISGAVTVRLLRSWRAWRENRRWADALAVFSVTAPVFLAVVAILEVAAPYHPSPPSPFLQPSPPVPVPFGVLFLQQRPYLALLQRPYLAAGLQLIVAACALLGRRRMTLIAMAASALFWVVLGYRLPLVPDALQLLAAGAYILAAPALLASPGPRRGRQLVTWRHWAVLLSAAAFAQASTLTLNGNYLGALSPQLDIPGYLAVSEVLAAVTVGLALALRLDRCFLLLAASMYPYAIQLAFAGILDPNHGFGTDLLSPPTPGHLAVLFGPPLLLACGITLTAIWPHRRRAVISAGR